MLLLVEEEAEVGVEAEITKAQIGTLLQAQLCLLYCLLQAVADLAPLNRVPTEVLIPTEGLKIALHCLFRMLNFLSVKFATREDIVL